TRPRPRRRATLAPILMAIALLASIGVAGLALVPWPQQPGRAQLPEPGVTDVSGPRATEPSDSPRRPRGDPRFVWM
ncbi:MAG: hypothetical protein ACM3SO_19320, partial [Betaproteobacteria bacterium]